MPYRRDDPVDEPTSSLRIVDPWLVPVQPTEKFRKESKTVRVPRSDFIMTCCRCVGSGTVRCPWCSGSGKDPFGKCNLCSGSGIYRCKLCDGHKKIKLYLVTKVKWSIKRSSVVIDTSNSGIKEKTFLKRTSSVIFEEEEPTAPFIAQLFDDTNSYQKKLAEAANCVILSHESGSHDYKKIILQKQTVEHIPIAAISYVYQKKDQIFHILGEEKKVVFHDAPSTLCTIL